MFIGPDPHRPWAELGFFGAVKVGELTPDVPAPVCRHWPTPPNI